MINYLKIRVIPSVADVLFISIFFLLTLFSGKVNLLSDGDTGYHIRAGEYILYNLIVPKADIFSFITPPLQWTAHEWLAEVIMAILHQAGGLTAIVTGFALMIALSVRLFFRNIQSDGNNILLTVIASIVFVVLSEVHWLARPHIFSLILLLIWYRLLDDFQYRQLNRLWILPLLMVLWVNLHGGFVIGLALLGIYLAGNFLVKFSDSKKWHLVGREQTKKLGRVLLVSIVACLANPAGYHIFIFPFKLISNKYIMDHVNEFLSPNFHEIQPFKYLLLLMIILFAYSRRKPDFIEITISILFTSMSLSSVRYIPLFAVTVIPVLLRYIKADWLSAIPGVESFLRRRVDNITLIDSTTKGYVWPALSILLMIFMTTKGTVTHAFSSGNKPLAALEFINENQIPGNMFNNDEFGDFVIYKSFKQYKVFIDGRLDMYGSDRLKEYDRVKGFEPGWESVMDKYKITWIFFDTNSALARFLSVNSDWKLIYSDKVASIFVKDIPMYTPLVEKFRAVKLANYSTGTNNGS